MCIAYDTFFFFFQSTIVNKIKMEGLIWTILKSQDDLYKTNSTRG